MFDEKYMQSGDKEIDSLEDALMVIACTPLCDGTSCDDCARNMYCDDGDCKRPRDDAEKYLREHSDDLLHLLGVPYDSADALENQQAVYEALFEKKILQNLGKAPEPKSEPKTGTCATCSLSEHHCSGIRWCKSFGNFVHADGYCYRFDPSDKMEAQPEDTPKAVCDWKKPLEKVIEVAETLPF